MTECPFHPQPEYRECHHVGDKYVVVYWGAGGMGGEGWISRLGTIGARGSISGWADKELDYMLGLLREEPVS